MRRVIDVESAVWRDTGVPLSEEDRQKVAESIGQNLEWPGGYCHVVYVADNGDAVVRPKVVYDMASKPVPPKAEEPPFRWYWSLKT